MRKQRKKKKGKNLLISQKGFLVGERQLLLALLFLEGLSLFFVFTNVRHADLSGEVLEDLILQFVNLLRLGSDGLFPFVYRTLQVLKIGLSNLF